MASAVQEQLAKISPTSGSAQLLERVRGENRDTRAQAAQQQAQAGPTLFDQTQQLHAEMAAKNATQEAEQRRLEAEHGKLATVGTQFGRGVLDALLAPGALAGAAWEATGELFGLEGVKRQGRDLGRASSGEAAIEAAAFLFGGGGKAGLTTAERVTRDVEEQQKAWPMLSAASHTAGMIAPALVGGGLSTGARGAAMVGVGAFEGAGAGAQAGYEQNAALRDVLSSALAGGALGAGAAGLGEGLVGLVKSKPLRAAARELSEDANLAAAGVRRPDLVRQFGVEAGAAEAKASELAGAIRDYRFQSGPLEGKPLMRMFRTQEGIQEGIQAAQAETQAALGAAREQTLQAARAAGALDEAALAGGASADALAEQALTAMGGNLDEFKALRAQAKSFQELGALVEKASQAPVETGSLGTVLGAAATVADLMGGAGSVSSIAKGLLTAVGHNVVKQRSASTIAALSNMLVLDTVSTALGHIMPTVERAAAGAAGRAVGGSSKATTPEPPPAPKPMTPEEKQDRYRDQLDRIAKAATAADPEERAAMIESIADLPPALVLASSADMSERLAQLHQDMPKPVPNIRGKAFETMSMQQVELANAMYEATTDPMSVFSDFAGGHVNYDKVTYAWKQYPGLKQAAQAGLMDILTVHLTEDDRAAVPDGLLSQLDNLFGFEGALQPSLDRSFAGRMDQLMQPAPQNPPPRPGGKLDSPLATPTFTQRLSGQQG